MFRDNSTLGQMELKCKHIYEFLMFHTNLLVLISCHSNELRLGERVGCDGAIVVRRSNADDVNSWLVFVQ